MDEFDPKSADRLEERACRHLRSSHSTGKNINGDDNKESVFSVSLSESDPSDVTKGDGIYSALVTNLPRSSVRFSYVVEIVNGSGTVDAGNRSIFRL